MYSYFYLVCVCHWHILLMKNLRNSLVLLCCTIPDDTPHFNGLLLVELCPYHHPCSAFNFVC